jgi:hypothetical protein
MESARAVGFDHSDQLERHLRRLLLRGEAVLGERFRRADAGRRLGNPDARPGDCRIAAEPSAGVCASSGIPKASAAAQMLCRGGLATYGVDNCAVNRGGPNCPDHWVTQEGVEGQVTGFQTTNDEKVSTPADVDSALQNALINSQAVFVELYARVRAGP